MQKALRPCAHPGCPVLIRNRECPDHPIERGPRKVYDHDWDVLRNAFLAVHPLCWCGQKATEVDHIIPIRMGGARLDPNNLRSLCHPHHSAVSKLYRKRFGPPRPYPRR